MNKNIIIAALSITIAVLLYYISNTEETVKTVVTERVEFIPIESSIPITKPRNVQIVKIKVPVLGKSVVEKDTIYMDIKTKKHTYKDTLENGIITSIIYADKIFKRSVFLKTNDKIITKETTNTVVKNSIFLNLGINKYIGSEIRDVNLGVDITIRNKFRLGVTTGYDIRNSGVFVGGKIGIPLN